MSDFNISTYGPSFALILAAAPLNELGPGKPVAAMKQPLDALASKEGLNTAFAPQRIVDQAMANACLAGLWLRFNYLDESHAISQEIHNPTGSFWHGILHRREPDYDNAKYWFRRVGNHPIFPKLNRDAQDLVKLGVGPQKFDPTANRFLNSIEWDPFTFVELVESVAGKPSSIEKLCRQIQRREWELLFDYCYHAAVGG
jgi:hypothetical protein